MYDVIVSGGLVVDGTGTPGVVTDVAVKDGKVARIGPEAATALRLLETLAERIASLCLADPRIRRAWVQIEKLDVYADVASVGIAIERFTPTP